MTEKKQCPNCSTTNLADDELCWVYADNWELRVCNNCLPEVQLQADVEKTR